MVKTIHYEKDYSNSRYSEYDNNSILLNTVIYLDSMGITTTCRNQSDVESDEIGIRLKLVIPKKMFEVPTITVTIPDDFSIDDKVDAIVDEIELPIAFDKEGGFSTDIKLASKEQGLISVIRKRLATMLDPDKK